ncbi:MAG: hypothetical protein QOD42_466 [Sphingomonadales bacterium]|jgi:hypothetical protein|nr:hypothetical protein [Sphingomonadales bacterium]
MIGDRYVPVTEEKSYVPVTDGNLGPLGRAVRIGFRKLFQAEMIGDRYVPVTEEKSYVPEILRACHRRRGRGG